jgi:prophage regulatory protein
MKRPVIRPKDIEPYTGLSIQTIYRLMKNGSFPAPLQLSANAVGWPLEAIEAWLASRKPVAR